MDSKRKAAFYTVGCKLNFSETSTLARKFVENGFIRVDPSDPADVYVINTCSVTDRADKKCRRAIRKFIKQSPSAVIAVTGCYAQLNPEETAAVEGVDIVLGADSKGKLFEYVNSIREKGSARIFSCDVNDVDSFFAAFSSGDRTRSFLKVQDGCSYNCSYCVIPQARGKSRNISIEKIVDEAVLTASDGTKEIVLTGVNIGDFGRSTGERFVDLLKALEKVEGVERYRISSIEPNLLSDEIIEFTSNSPKFLPHYHIPLQSGSDKILGLMRRRYKKEDLAAGIDKIRRKRPDTFFGIDVIAGFPGETDEDFYETYKFLEESTPAFLHIFPYSERPGTVSAGMENKTPKAIIEARAGILKELNKKLHRDFYVENIGKISKTLFESSVKRGKMFGFTENYIKVEIDYDKRLSGKIVSVKLGDLTENGTLKAELV